MTTEFYLIITMHWANLLALSVLGMALGLARGAYGHNNAVMNPHVIGRMIKFGTLGFCAAFLWSLALVMDSQSDSQTIPTGPVINLLILIALSLWSDEILQAFIGAGNKVTDLVQKQLINRIPLLNGNSKKAK